MAGGSDPTGEPGGGADLMSLFFGVCRIPKPLPFSLWSRYSKMTLMTWTMARIRDPKASEPVWYLPWKESERIWVRGHFLAPFAVFYLFVSTKRHCIIIKKNSSTYLSARPKDENRGKAGMSSGFLKAQ